MDKLSEHLKNIPNEYKSIPFWSWNNGLNEAELLRQIEDMKSAGTGGFIMHARTGLKDEYLGEKWFSCVGACLKKARELGMDAWIYDENGWPSGFVGGKLLETESYRAQYLEYERKDSFDETAFAVFKRTEKGYARIHGAEKEGKEYHTVYLRTSPANTDILNPEVVDAFIRETHEKYYQRFPDSFGRELVGFFTDEPQYYRWGTPYTKCAAAEFEKDGEDIRDGLIYLFVHDKAGYPFRVKYFTTLNRLYTENFYKKLYDWCENHHCLLTGHSVEESSLWMQMWGGAGVMPSYEYEHIPGIDCLERNCGTELAPKQVGSVAAQLGKKHVLTETFGCSGYDVTPKELKSIGDYQYFNGVNVMCQHLYPYSLADQGKYDHPPVFSPQGNWFEGFAVFNDYFNRLGYIIANTVEKYDVGVIHPMRSIYTEYVRSEDCESVRRQEESFGKLIAELRRKGIMFQLIDERIAEKYGKIENGALKIGACVYHTVIVPEMNTISAPAYELLKGHQEKMLVTGEIPRIDGREAKVELASNTTMAEIAAKAQIRFECEDGRSFVTARSGEMGDFVFVKNLSRTEQSRVTMKGISQRYRKLDLETLEREDASDAFTLGGGESAIFIADAEAHPANTESTSEDVTSAFVVTGITENFVTLDAAEMSLDGKIYGKKKNIQGLFEELLRKDYKGTVYIKHTFSLKDEFPLKLVAEKKGYLSFTVNGKELDFVSSAFDVNFIEADISEWVKAGENELIYSIGFYQHEGVHFALFDPLATESVRNCLYYDTSVENVYLKGDFTVNPDMSLERPKELPEVTSRLYQCGYPFFKGELTLKGKIVYDGKGKTELCVSGRFLVADVVVNGHKTSMVLDTKRDVTKYLQCGENEVEITLKSSLRNLLGPHHYKPVAEPMGVNPYMFTFRGQWDGKDPDGFTDDYHFVPFGADGICLIKTTARQE